MRMLQKYIPSMINGIYAIIYFYIIAVCLFFNDIQFGRIEYTVYESNRFLPFFLTVIGIIIISLLSFLIIFFNVQVKFKSVLCISVVILFVQILFVYSYYFYTDWDANTLVTTAYQIANGMTITTGDYFSTYPNNLFIVFIFSSVIKLCNLFNIPNSYFFLLVMQSVLAWITGLLLYKVLYSLTKDKGMSILGWIIFVLLVEFSPWLSIPYSDSTGLIFPVLLISIFCLKLDGKKEYLKWFIIGFISFVGYKIKPQIIIVLIAIIIISFKDIKFDLRLLKEKMFTTLTIVCGIVFAVFLTKACILSLNIDINKDKEFGISHFLMMGLSDEYLGVWSPIDVQISENEPNTEERTKKNFQIASERIERMGPTGLFHLIQAKTLTNFGDGTFCWGGEGVFYSEFIDNHLDYLGKITKQIIYNRDYVTRWYEFFRLPMNCLWFTTLITSFGIILKKKKSNEILTIMLTLIGSTLFQTIFECRARYLYIFAPLYIILSVYVVKNGIHFIKKLNYIRKENTDN